MRFSFSNLLSKRSHWWPIIALFLLEIILFATNYTPGTFLMGWDNVMPEFNFRQALITNISGVWLEYRGVGLYDGMSHIANLPHTIFLWLLSLTLPTNLLRYAFIFLTHFLGGLGMYFLLQFLIDKKTAAAEKLSIPHGMEFVGALFYLFNPAAIQMFYTPLEAFSVHFAALPWLALTLLNYISNGSKESLTAFFFIALISTPQYFVATLFLPIAIVLSVISVIVFLHDKTTWKRILASGIGFLSINIFWLLPYLYGLPQNAPVIAQAKINQMSSGEAFARNQAFGDLKNVLLMRGFSLDFEDVMPDGTFTYLMAPWRNFLNSPFITAVNWLLMGATFFGLAMSFHKQYRRFLPFSFIFFTAMIFLGNDIPIVSTATETLRAHVPFFGEAFRFPFTKFSLLFSFSASALIGVGLTALPKQIKNISIIVCITLIGFLSLPAFRGNFIYQNLRITLPQEYMQFFAFMKTQDPNGRIALLPQPSYWSWKFYRFGYRGSGFLWYGLPQPIMDRAFDPWSATSENYYWELTRALYSKDATAIDHVFTKYDIRYILLDENLISTSNDRSLFIDESKELLTATPAIQPMATFGNLTLYERTDEESQSFIALKANLPTVSPIYQWTDNDRAFSQLGDYIASPSGGDTYPLRSLFTKRSVNEREFSVEPKEENLVFDTTTQSVLTASSVTKCGLLRPGTIRAENQTEDGKSWLRFSAVDQRACLSFGVPDLSHKNGYIVAVESRHISGRPLLFSLINETAKHVEEETYLPLAMDWETSYFILPPLAADGLGYSVYVNNDAIGRKETINDLARIRFYTFPYQKLISLQNRPSSENSALAVFHPNPAYYRVTINTPSLSPDTTLILSQSFDPGWVAWDGKQFLPHILVNNWENGWVLDEKTIRQKDDKNNTLTVLPSSSLTVSIIFLPQLLEWIGFALIPIPFFICLKTRQ